MPPTDSKTKIRPQQSCLKCRERKVKCDRAVPCHACIIRGLESECVYLTTAQDRAHIGQAEIIDRLRREVAQLRAELNQSTREPNPSSRFGTRYNHSYEGNWPGSSPSSSATTLTSSATVTSPDSTGSEGGMSAPSVSAAYPASMGPCIAAMKGDSTVPGGSFMDDASLSHCHAAGTMFAPGEEDPHLSHHQWRPDVGENPFPPAQPYATTSDATSDPSSWKGERKQELLETLLETIGSCDEDCVAQVIQVVRTSATPEAALTGICRVSGVAGR